MFEVIENYSIIKSQCVVDLQISRNLVNQSALALIFALSEIPVIILMSFDASNRKLPYTITNDIR